MRFPIFLAAFTIVCNYVCAQRISIADSIEIVNKIADWNNGWKIKDYKLTTKWYSDASEFTNAFGHNRIGKLQIEEFMKEVFHLPFVMAGDSKVASQKLIPLNDNIVLVITAIERTGQKTPDESNLGIRQTTHHRIFKKESEWLIAAHLISDARDTQSNKH